MGAEDQGQQLLVDFFRGEGKQWGQQGDYLHWTPERCAVETMRRLHKAALGRYVAPFHELHPPTLPDDADGVAKYQRVTFKQYEGREEWQTGLARVKAFGLSDVSYIISDRGMRVDNPHDYRLIEGPMCYASTTDYDPGDDR